MSGILNITLFGEVNQSILFLHDGVIFRIWRLYEPYWEMYFALLEYYSEMHK